MDDPNIDEDRCGASHAGDASVQYVRATQAKRRKPPGFDSPLQQQY